MKKIVILSILLMSFLTSVGQNYNMIQLSKQDSLLESNKDRYKLYKEIGYRKWCQSHFEESNFYFTKSKNYYETPDIKIKQVPKKSDIESEYLDDVYNINYEGLSKDQIQNRCKDIDSKILKLQSEQADTISWIPDFQKENILKQLTKEKELEKYILKSKDLEEQKARYHRYLVFLSISVFVLVLVIVLITIALYQRKKIVDKDRTIGDQMIDINKKNTYLEHAAKIIRHDMHSGINQYIPRGISSLEKKLSSDKIKELKIESALKMIKEGLSHTQIVYKGVYEFTNLVKGNKELNKSKCDLKEILTEYLLHTAYKDQVKIGDLPTIEVNPILFCTAIDNMIKNGLNYNDSQNKEVTITHEKGVIYIQDNGRGLSEQQFKEISNPDWGSKGIGLKISLAILDEHGFKVECEKNKIGTKLMIKLS